MDYKSVFTNLCLELQQNRSWIKGLGKNPFTHSIPFTHSLTDGSAFCPGAPKRVPLDSEKHRRVYTSSNVCHSHEWHVDTASGLTLKKQNACLHAVRHAVEKKIACIHGLRSEGVNIWALSGNVVGMCISLCFTHGVFVRLLVTASFSLRRKWQLGESNPPLGNQVFMSFAQPLSHIIPYMWKIHRAPQSLARILYVWSLLMRWFSGKHIERFPK